MKALSITLFTLLSLNVLASKRYIVGPQKVTFRSTPNNTGKIIKMVEVTSKMNFIEEMENGW